MLKLKKKISKIAKKVFNSDLKLAKGTRAVSFLFIFLSMIIAGGVLFAANTYYDLDSSEVITEEVQRTTELTRATGGLIAGGGDTDTLEDGVKLQVSGGDLRVGSGSFTVDEGTGNTYVGGTSTFASTSTFEDTAVWQDGDSNVIGFQAPDDVSDDQIYTLPEDPTSGYVLQTDDSGNLTWVDAESTVEGDITDVGDVSNGAAFTEDGSGNSLWFEGTEENTNEIELTANDPSADRTINLPDLSGTVSLQDGELSAGSILFANSDGQITQDNTNFYWDDTDSRLGIGTDNPQHTLDVNGTIRSGQGGTDGELRLYSGQSDYTLAFQPNATMTEDTTYQFPADKGSEDYVLSTDGSGKLEWTSVGDTGALSGSGTANRVAMWDDSSSLTDSSIEDDYTGGVALTIDDTGTTSMSGGATVGGTLDANKIAGYTLTGNITGDGSPDISGIGEFSGNTATLADSVESPEFTSGGTTTVASADDKGILLDPDSGKIKIASGDELEKDSGYQIAATDDQVLREMVPIFGFDLPAQSSATEYKTISRKLESDPFPAAKDGATRRYKLIIRYGDDTSGDANAIDWEINGASLTDSSFATDGTASSSEEQGEVAIHEVDSDGESIISEGDNWTLDMNPNGNKVRVYQVFLAAYDEID